MTTIGKKIKNRRIELGMSQDELAEKMGYKNEGIRRNFYKSPTENALIMTKRRTV